MKDYTIAVLSLVVAQMERTMVQVSAWAARLATWLIVGNAGALVLALQVLRESGSGPYAELAFTSGRLFAVGLVLAFVGGTLAYISLIWTRNLQNTALDVAHTYAHAAATEQWRRDCGVAAPEEVLEAQDQEIERQAARLAELTGRMGKGPNRLGLVSLLCLAASAIVFMAGMAMPLIKLQPASDGPSLQEFLELGRTVQDSVAANTPTPDKTE